jgi:hypothetical protein
VWACHAGEMSKRVKANGQLDDQPAPQPPAGTQLAAGASSDAMQLAVRQPAANMQLAREDEAITIVCHGTGPLAEPNPVDTTPACMDPFVSLHAPTCLNCFHQGRTVTCWWCMPEWEELRSACMHACIHICMHMSHAWGQRWELLAAGALWLCR